MRHFLILANHSGGLYDFRKDLILELRKQGRVTAVVPRNNRWEQLAEIVDDLIELPIDRRGLNPIHDLSLFRKYRRILKERKPDLVITYTIKPNIYGGIACRMAKTPYAANITGLGSAIVNGGLLKHFVLKLYRLALKKSGVVFFENSANRDMIVQAGIIPEEKTVLLNGAGVNLDDYPFQQYPQESPVRFLFVGRVMKEKGVEEFFCAAKRIKAEYGDYVAFSVAGSYEEQYKLEVEALEEAGVLTFLGYRKDMVAVYGEAHCLVLPSYHEGMSNVLLEAAASGRPLITTDIPGCREAVKEGISGFLCKPKDAESLYAAMRRFLECSMLEHQKMGLAGRKHTEECFDKRTVVQKTLWYLKQKNN